MWRYRPRAVVLPLLLAALTAFGANSRAAPAADAASGSAPAAPKRSATAHDRDPEGEVVAAPGIDVVAHSAYWLELAGFGSEALGSAAPPPPLLVIRGEMRNASGAPLHHVRFSYELLDRDGRVVALEEGYNRSAEVLKPLDPRGRVFVGEEAAARPVASRDSDTFRMLFFAADVPPFATYRVRAVEAAPEPSEPARSSSH